MIGETIRSGEADLARDLSESIFLLKKSSSSSTASIQVDFSPLVNREEPSQSIPKSLPTFNSDRHHFTPSFVLEVDQERYRENEEVYMKIHNRKVSQISEQKTELFVPRPSKNNSYCCICKTPFQDYLTHVSTPKHHYLTGKSDYNSKIKGLCQLMKEKRSRNEEKTSKNEEKEIKPAGTPKKRGRPAKTKMIQKICLKNEPKLERQTSTSQLPVSINP